MKKKSDNQQVVISKKEENKLTNSAKLSRRNSIKKVGIISLTAASMFTLLSTQKALATSVYPANAGNDFNLK